MIPELGHFALILALVLALAQGTLPLLGAARGVPAWSALARPLAVLQFGFILLAFICLAHAFAGNDFSVAVVATHSHTQLPLPFRLAATWGSHPGSLLLWVLMLSGWTVAVALRSRGLPTGMAARAIGVLGGVSVGFLSFLLLTSNPFERLLPVPMQGSDLNPLLQDWGMVIHPPMLYMGYVGFGVAFAFAIAALLGDRLDAAWARAARPWATAAWCFLTAGIALGSWWAYRELGWGGWWFWDPVENASFMPWLVGTALMHSLAVADKRGALLGWTVLLAIAAFSLSLLGTFLVRSGVLSSVHAFAADPARGFYLLAFLALVVGGSLALYAARAPQLAPAGAGGRFQAFSRETLLMANNVLLMAAAGTVLLGTLYPLVLDVLGAGRISVGTPYFESVLVPILAPLAFLMGLGPLARWQQASLPELATRLKWAFAVSACVAVLLPAALGGGSARVSLGLLLASWIVAGSAVNLYGRVGHRQAHGMSLGTHPPVGLLRRLAAQPRGYYGMLLAHCGLAVFIAGVTAVKGFETERELRMAVGDSVSIGADEFRFTGASPFRGPNYDGVRGVVELHREGRQIDTLYPERRHYDAQGSTMTEAAIHSGFLGDRYVALGESLGERPGDPRGGTVWSLRVQAKPLIGWIWAGCSIMVLGGLLALGDRRYRVAARQRAMDAAPPRGMALAPAAREATVLASNAPAADGRRALLALMLAVPCAAGLVYARLGNPAAASVSRPPSPEAGQALVDRMMAHLTSHLAEQPGDLEGWRLLARSCEAMKRFPEAAQAYARLAELQPARSAAQADALADQADALSMTQAGRFAGAPMAQVTRALLIDPDNRKALAMAGNEAFERRDYAAAVGYWERLRPAAPVGSALATSLEAQIAGAQELAVALTARGAGGPPGP